MVSSIPVDTTFNSRGGGRSAGVIDKPALSLTLLSLLFSVGHFHPTLCPPIGAHLE